MEKYPENTDVAFEAALRVGAHGIETGNSPLHLQGWKFTR
jgi:hypothetical protein